LQDIIQDVSGEVELSCCFICH